MVSINVLGLGVFSPVKLQSCCNAVFTYALYFFSAKILSVCA